MPICYNFAVVAQSVVNEANSHSGNSGSTDAKSHCWRLERHPKAVCFGLIYNPQYMCVVSVCKSITPTVFYAMDGASTPVLVDRVA